MNSPYHTSAKGVIVIVHWRRLALSGRVHILIVVVIRPKNNDKILHQ